MSATQYPTYAAGQKLTAAQLQLATPLMAIKAADQSIASQITLQDDADLQFLNLPANAVYEVTGILYYGADPTTGKLKIGFLAPAGATFSWVALGTNGSANPASSFIIDRQLITSTSYALGAVTGNTTIISAHIRGILRMGGTAGTFKLQWAQQGSTATATIMKADTYLRLQRAA